MYKDTSDPQSLLEQALEHFRHLSDPVLQANIFSEAGLALARSSGALKEQCANLAKMSLVKWRTGDSSGSQIDAQEIQKLAQWGGDLLEESKEEAEVHLQKSEYTEALNIHVQILSRICIEKEAPAHAYSLLNIAEIETMAGASSHSVHMKLDQAKSIFEAVGYPVGMLGHNMICGDLSLREGNTLVAKQLLLQCFNLARGTIVETGIYCLE
ncbi:hypothetical protein FB451DRAFT_1194167 [Mycena latifolia]|nr:hypothetical protein FB451DRAFT_1194167 [Mycena latifolia]